MLKVFQNFSRKMSTISSNRLSGKVAVVTASTDGIGYAIARRLAQEGAKVMVSSRKEKKVNETVQKLTNEGLSVAGQVCHVSNAEHRQSLFKNTKEKFGGIDILVSNAAANPSVGSVLDCDEPSWDKIFDVNVKSSFLLAKEVLPYLRERKGGSIIFVSSIAGLQPFQLLGAYSVSKTALLGLTKAAAESLATENIRVNCLAPGIIETKFSSAITDNEISRNASLEKIPMQRFGTIEEMGGVVAFLVSDDASYITGETIVASGGMQSRL
ncbi:dehydrogenase/reductase SDR family member 4-like [Chrysoperla carnea]|uniref:dehydrogenase/reductase SDR family member 4-like n=1 Tax=Chrysoperla carnea TaxID=189513 RepID=UPI001D074F16|nr:dehydrogenase/reductase SDR family member 4-like [Chrysoperla carnea]